VILLVAVSARMLAELARREGHEVTALDRFGDLDLQRLCRSVSIQRDLGGRGGMAALVDAAEGMQARSVIYGAGLENMPALVARLAAGRTLLGCGPEILRRVRDPALLGASLGAAGHAYPRTFAAREAPARADRTRRWLRKPLRGGGGRGVREWRGGDLPAGVIVQERVPGLPCSAAAVADGGSAALLGVSEQLIGRPAFGARGYAWCGNLVPPRLASRERHALTDAARAICAHLAAAFGLRGLFGVDLVWDGRRAWVVEVNPRPTASLETIEAVHGVRAFAVHLEGCAGPLPAVRPTAEVQAHVQARAGRLPAVRPMAEAQAHVQARAGRLPADPPSAEPAKAAGKAVVFATGNVRVPDTRAWPARGIRDVPHPGEPIAAGHPICTLVATGRAPEDVLADLEARAAALRAELHDRAETHAVA
jgi:predicted ATP-grasp superfamily ATP-dependent carboligase